MLNEFQEKIYRSSVPLRRLNEARVPTGGGSGVIVSYGGKRLLLTAGHVTQDQQNWAVELEYDPSQGVRVYQLGPMRFLAEIDLKNHTLRDIDFAYVEIPESLVAKRQCVSETGKIISSVNVAVHDTTLTELPMKGRRYGFSGTVKLTAEAHPNAYVLGSELRICDSLSFKETRVDEHVFSLGYAHPGHIEFRGCSGAPVIDEDGVVVGILRGGCVTRNEIYVVSLARYKIALDIYLTERGVAT